MSKETKSILLSCIFGLIFCFIVVSLNYKEEDENTKKEKVVEAKDIGIEEVEEVKEKKETTNSTSNENNTKSISEPKKEESKEKSEVKEKVEEESKEVNEEPKEEKEESSNLISLGKFKLTAYCSCSKCCGKWAGSPIASGTMPKANHTIAVDTSVIPFGTKVIINGNTYVAEDTGSAIKGNKIDVFFDSHSKALNFGVKYAEVFVVK